MNRISMMNNILWASNVSIDETVHHWVQKPVSAASQCIQLSDNPGVPGMKDDEPRNRKRRPFHSEAGNILRRTKYFKSKINTYWVRVGR